MRGDTSHVTNVGHHPSMCKYGGNVTADGGDDTDFVRHAGHGDQQFGSSGTVFGGQTTQSLREGQHWPTAWLSAERDS